MCSQPGTRYSAPDITEHLSHMVTGGLTPDELTQLNEVAHAKQVEELARKQEGEIVIRLYDLLVSFCHLFVVNVQSKLENYSHQICYGDGKSKNNGEGNIIQKGAEYPINYQSINQSASRSINQVIKATNHSRIIKRKNPSITDTTHHRMDL